MNCRRLILCLLVAVLYKWNMSSAELHSSPLDLIQMENLQVSQDASDLSQSVSLEASPKLINNGDWVTLRFQGIKRPDANDWIGVFSPANVDLKTTSPLKYKFAKSSKDYLSMGAGELRFKMVNMHADFVFVLFRNGVANPVYVARSNVCTFANLEEPLQGHLALADGEDYTKMRLGWATGYNTTQPQWVKWGLEPGMYMIGSAESTPYTYHRKELCGQPGNASGWRAPGTLHTAVMTNLNPSTRYYYVYGSDQTGWSGEASFRSVPVPSAKREVTLVTFGDLGKGEEDGSLEHWGIPPALNTTKNIAQMIDEVDAIVHIGDISYAVGYSSQWDTFMQQMLPIATRVPYMTSPGNHERDYLNSGSLYKGKDSGGECGVPYEHRYIMPAPSNSHILEKINKPSTTGELRTGAGKDTLWYSFNYGNVHVIMMSTEHNFSVDSDQYKWLVDDLTRVNRAVTPWVIFTGHRPMYIDSTDNRTVAAGDQTVAKLMRKNLEPVLLKYQVNLALWGHHHSYQRTCPVFKEQCQDETQKGRVFPVHVVIGMAGMPISGNVHKVNPEWIEHIELEFGYTRIHTTQYTLHFQFFNNQNELKDEFFLESPF